MDSWSLVYHLQPLRPQDPLPLPLVHLSTNTDISDETSIANLDSSYFSQWSPQTLFSFLLILGGLSSSSSDFPATNLLWLVAIFYPSSLLFLLSFSSCLLTLQEHWLVETSVKENTFANYFHPFPANFYLEGRSS